MTNTADHKPVPAELGERRLERERDQIFERIRNYPSPITACDDQFNYLLEERDRIARELAQIRQARAARSEP